MPPSLRDVYANLLRTSRELRRDQASARDAWYGGLEWLRKEETLFELEMLLKGLACFANSRNHPRSPGAGPDATRDHRYELMALREALERSLRLIRDLLGERDRAYSFSRYLETVLHEDAERSRLVKEQLTQDTPIEALWVLRNSFSDYVDVIDGLGRLEEVSHRHLHALLGVITREIGRNSFFNPLMALEFRPEFDRIRSAEVLEALTIVQSESAHRVTALTFLTLFRCLRYLDLVDEYAASATTTRLAYVILAVYRSDMRTLTAFLQNRAAGTMAAGLERELMSVRSDQLPGRFDELAGTAASLVTLRGILQTTATALRIEEKRCFEHTLVPIDTEVSEDEMGPQIIVATAVLRATLHHAIEVVCKELMPGRPPLALTSDVATRRATSERLRRDVWMFRQILRAFLAKSRASPSGADRWEAKSSFDFVREFLAHFRAIGYQLMRSSDYDRLDPFLSSLEGLRDLDLLIPERLHGAIRESARFYEYLEQLFDQISERQELVGVAFDRKQAAETLRIYLGAL